MTPKYEWREDGNCRAVITYDGEDLLLIEDWSLAMDHIVGMLNDNLEWFSAVLAIAGGKEAMNSWIHRHIQSNVYPERKYAMARFISKALIGHLPREMYHPDGREE